jgi:hypothetical protein
MKGLVTLGTLSLVSLVGAGVGVGWFLNAAHASLHQDHIASRTKPSGPFLS